MELMLLLLFGALICSALASAQPEDKETGPSLSWEFTSKPIPGAERNEKWYFQEAVRLEDARGRTLWRAELPERMKAYQAGIGDLEVSAHEYSPRQTPAHFPFLCRVVCFDGLTLRIYGTAPYRLEQQATYSEKENRQAVRFPSVSAKFCVGGIQVLVDGIITL